MICGMSKTEAIPYRQFVKRLTTGQGVATSDGGRPVGIARANKLVAMDKAGATNEELGKTMGGFANLRKETHSAKTPISA